VMRFPPGAARLIPAGSVLLLDAFHLPMGTPARDHVRIGLTIAQEPPSARITTLAIAPESFTLPAGAAHTEVSAELALNETTTLSALTPVLRSHGNSVRYDLITPEGTRTLLDIPQYEFKWRCRYELAEPLELPRGARIRITATFDNSSANPDNTNPGQVVTSGPAPGDECLMGLLEVVVPLGSAQP
jgi:hypothetical protein